MFPGQKIIRLCSKIVRTKLVAAHPSLRTDEEHQSKEIRKLKPGANPTIVSYNASAVKFYNAASSLVRLIKKYFHLCIYFEKRSSILQWWQKS
jgi:hypothetical protein